MRTRKVIAGRMPSSICIDLDKMAQHESDNMCRTIVECVKKLFENPAVQADYEKYLIEEERKKQ